MYCFDHDQYFTNSVVLELMKPFEIRFKVNRNPSYMYFYILNKTSINYFPLN